MAKGFYSDGRRWPKLSETLKGPKCPGQCQRCGAVDEVSTVGEWVECDNDDQPTAVVVLLCEPCGDQVIGPHPRLYHPVDRWTPRPGTMPLCVSCRHRDGLTCKNPLLKANGGEGLRISGPMPMVGMIDYSDKAGRRRGRRFQHFSGPAEECAGRQTVDGDAPGGGSA